MSPSTAHTSIFTFGAAAAPAVFENSPPGVRAVTIATCLPVDFIDRFECAFFCRSCASAASNCNGLLGIQFGIVQAVDLRVLTSLEMVTEASVLKIREVLAVVSPLYAEIFTFCKGVIPTFD